MAKFKIIYDRDACIGVFACIDAAKKFWKRSEKEQNKVDLVKGKWNEKTKKFELEIDEKDWAMANESAVVCPVAAIKVVKVKE